jgi:signal transduction histidine kinase
MEPSSKISLPSLLFSCYTMYMSSLEELQSENEKLKKTVEVKSDLISISSHQLRTSLAALKWILGMFTGHDSANMTKEQKNLIDKAIGSSEHMLYLVNNLLTLNHTDTTAIVLQKKEVDVKKLLEDIVFEFKGYARNMSVSLAHADKTYTVPSIICDPEMIRIVLSGLLENAIKYSAENGTVTSSIVEDSKDKMIEISIHNTGTIIGNEEQEKIFNKFFRSKNVVDKKVSGSGLGLYIAKKIIECHNGKIWFESSEGTGTTFFIALPINTQVV